MTDRRPRAVVYAEDTLGFLRLYDESKAYVEDYALAARELAATKPELAKCKQAMADLEVDLYEASRTEVSAETEKVTEAAVERRFKKMRRESTSWRTLHDKIEFLTFRVDELGTEVDIAKSKAQTNRAQVTAVGSYLEFLAAHRVATTEAVKHANLPY